MAAPPGVGATPSATNGIGPKIQFNTETYDSGTNLAGDKIFYTFLVTNTGDEKLVLEDVHASCGCTTVGTAATSSGSASTWTHEIEPGKIGIIPVQVATENLRGQVHKTVTVKSNDRTRPMVTLNIGGTVWLPIEISPQMVSFALMPDATNLSLQVVHIYNRAEKPLAIWDPTCTTNAFGLQLKTNVPGQEYELTVTAPPPSRFATSATSSSLVQGEISLETSVSNRNPLKITVFETVLPEITVFPNSIQVQAAPLTQPSTSHITIRDNIADLHVSEASLNVPGSSVSTMIVTTNRQYYFSVTFPQGFDARGMTNLGLTVKTDNPRFPTLTIPVTAVPAVTPLQPLPPRIAATSTNAPQPVQFPPLRNVVMPPPPRSMVQAPGLATNPPAPPVIKVNSPQP